MLVRKCSNEKSNNNNNDNDDDNLNLAIDPEKQWDFRLTVIPIIDWGTFGEQTGNQGKNRFSPDKRIVEIG